MSIYKIKTKQNKTHVNRKIQKINSKREKKTFLQSQVLEVARKLLTPVVGNNERKRRFWAFFDEKKVDLIGTIDDRQCISISGRDLRQRLSRFGVERKESWRC